MTTYLTATATISPCRAYRYDLIRLWDGGLPACLWVMLNPSTADATKDDPTIRRCVGFARAWGYGGLVVCNLFALRATDPAELYAHPDPVGPDNDRAIDLWAGRLPLAVAAWGVHGKHRDRGWHVRDRLRAAGVGLHYVEKTKDGYPKHPLYLKGGLTPRPFFPAAAGVTP